MVLRHSKSPKNTPEQQRAIGVLIKALPLRDTMYIKTKNRYKMFPTNFMAFSSEPFHKLPHEDHWMWNQSNAKVSTKLDSGAEVTFQKMNTRKKKNFTKAPSYKIWLFTVLSNTSNEEFFFMWCEKGLNTDKSSHNIQSLPSPVPLSDHPTSPLGSPVSSPISSHDSFEEEDEEEDYEDQLEKTKQLEPPSDPLDVPPVVSEFDTSFQSYFPLLDEELNLPVDDLFPTFSLPASEYGTVGLEGWN